MRQFEPQISVLGEQLPETDTVQFSIATLVSLTTYGFLWQHQSVLIDQITGFWLRF